MSEPRFATPAQFFAEYASTPTEKGCIEWFGRRNDYDYGAIGPGSGLRLTGTRATLAHRVVWLLKKGPIPFDLDVCHTCDHPPCGNIDHLFLGTALENTTDAVRKGRIHLGAASKSAKLSQAQVDEIRRLYVSDTRVAEIAAQFGVCKGTIYAIGRGDRWAGYAQQRPKLSHDQVVEIRHRAAAGETQTALAVEFGVHQGSISRIVSKLRRGSWLTKLQATEIKQRYAAGGVSARGLAADYDVAADTVRAVLRGKNHGDAEGPPAPAGQRLAHGKPLVEVQRAEIRARRARGESQRVLADEFGVSRVRIRQIEGPDAKRAPRVVVSKPTPTPTPAPASAPKRTRRRWTPADDKLLVELRAAGVPLKDIAARAGRSRDVVVQRVRRLVASGAAASTSRAERSRRGARAAAQSRTDLWQPSEDEQIIQRWKAGDGPEAIAAGLEGRTLEAVEGRVHKLRVRGAIAPLTLEERKARQRRERSARTQRDLEAARRRFAALPNTRDLGYVIGVLFGDGFVHQRDKMLGLRTTDETFAEAFAGAVQVGLGAESPKRHTRDARKTIKGRVYDVIYYEVELYDNALACALVEAFGDTRTFQWEIDVEKALARGAEFCRGLVAGLFDSDGSFSLVGKRGISIRSGTHSVAGAASLHRLMLALGFDVGLAPPNCKKENKVGVHAASTMKFAREVSSRIQYKLATLSEYQRRAAA